MPAFITHYYFAEMTCPDKEHFLEFALGSQGPDPLFFHSATINIFASKRVKVRKFASWLHRNDPSEIYAKMVVESKDDDALYAFCLGLMAHYCIDKNIHPMVYYRTGFDKDGHLKQGHSYNHFYYESLLDAYIAITYHVTKRPWQTLALPRDRLLKVSRLWSKATFLAPRSYFRGVKMDRLVNRLLDSKTGAKRKIYIRRSHMYACTPPVDLEEAMRYDVANTKHAVWKNPESLVESTASVDDLLLIAKKEFEQGKEIFDAIRRGEDKSKELHEFMGILNHAGERYGYTKREYKSVFEEKE